MATSKYLVDDFGIKYQGIKHVHHLLNAIKADYQVEVDWDRGLYCGIELKWNYEKGYVDISMPGYIKKQLTRYAHPHPKHRRNSPYDRLPPK